MKFASNGKTVACGQWTSRMKTHFRVSVAHCSDKDKFSKKEGKQIASIRMEWNQSIVLPANVCFYGRTAGLKMQLQEFLRMTY